MNRCAHFACQRDIPLDHYACREHWDQLPYRLRLGLTRAWATIDTRPDEYRRWTVLAEAAWNQARRTHARR